MDVNVGRSAKWLRVIGYDASVPTTEDVNELVLIALAEDRIIVTRDEGIAERRPATTGRITVLLIEHADLKSQLDHVTRSLGLKGRAQFSRCIRCNEPLAEISRQRAEYQVPPHVFDTQSEFRECPACRRVFWRGTHWANMNRELSQLRDGET